MTLNYTHCRQDATVTLTGEGLGQDGKVYLDNKLAPGQVWVPPAVHFQIPMNAIPNQVLKISVRTQGQNVQLGDITVDASSPWMGVFMKNYDCR